MIILENVDMIRNVLIVIVLKLESILLLIMEVFGMKKRRNIQYRGVVYLINGK